MIRKEEIINGVTARLQQLGIITGPRSFSSDFIASVRSVVEARKRGRQPEALPPPAVSSASSGSSFHSGITSITGSTLAAPNPSKPKTVAELNAERLAKVAASQRPFEYADLKDAKTVSDQAALFDSIDFGLGYRGARKQVAIATINNLCIAYSSNYDQEREQLAESLGQIVGGAVTTKLQAAFIQPVSSAIASTGIDILHNAMKEHNAKVRQRLTAGGGRKLVADGKGGFALSERVPYSGVAAGDSPNERLTKADRQLRKEMNEMPATSMKERTPEEILAGKEKVKESKLGTNQPKLTLSATGGENMGHVVSGAGLLPSQLNTTRGKYMEQIANQKSARTLQRRSSDPSFIAKISDEFYREKSLASQQIQDRLQQPVPSLFDKVKGFSETFENNPWNQVSQYGIDGVEAEAGGRLIVYGKEQVERFTDTNIPEIKSTISAASSMACKRVMSGIRYALGEENTQAVGNQVRRVGDAYSALPEGTREALGLGIGSVTAGALGTVGKVAYNKFPFKTIQALDIAEVKPKLPNDIAATFDRGKYTARILERDTILYRAGSKDYPLGEFFSKDKPISEVQVRINKAIPYVWQDGTVSTIDTVFKVKVPAGTVVYAGRIGYQTGSFVGQTKQIVIPRKLQKNITILETIPIKK